jgi:hypothetical protein
MSSRTVLIDTDAAGDYTYERPCFGLILAVLTDVGDLDTPNIVISDSVSATTIRTLTGLAADDYWQPATPVAVFGTLRVAVTDGGDTKHGRVRFLLET